MLQLGVEGNGSGSQVLAPHVGEPNWTPDSHLDGGPVEVEPTDENLCLYLFLSLESIKQSFYNLHIKQIGFISLALDAACTLDRFLKGGPAS